jgi:16S rRNA (guanine966-N2)-methyltransferase
MRITGGAFRSRALRAPRGQATRPTSDRVREALFGILSSAGALDGVRVLDLYAGTGALALEALSRGASDATLVEAAREALDAIRANVKSLAVEDRVRVVAGDVREAVRRLRGPFDLVLADPPWTLVEEGEAPRALALLVGHGALAERGLVVLEHASRSPSPTIEQLAERSTRRYGDTSLTFYERGPLREPRRKS